MYFAKQTISLVALVSTLSSGLALAMSPAQADAQGIRYGQLTAHTVLPQSSVKLAVPTFITGTWQGTMHSAGDDALTHLTLHLNGSDSTYKGTWQVDGQDGVLESGSLTASKQSTTMTVNLKGLGGKKAVVLTGTMNANGTAMSGKVLNSNFVFSFTKG